MPAPQALVKAVSALDLQPRLRRWTSLSYCLIDAVWSIGARYDTVVAPLVYRVAVRLGDLSPTVELPALMPPDPAPMSQFLSAFPDPAALMTVTNRQRTSTRGGIPKTQAALEYAQVFHEAGVETLGQATVLTDDPDAFTEIDRKLRQVSGEGNAGVRRGYLWMLTGDDHRVKPDRMVLRWLSHHGITTDANHASQLLLDVAAELTTTKTQITRWMVDHAIWLDARTRTSLP